MLTRYGRTSKVWGFIMTRYRITRIDLGDLHTDPTFTDLGIISEGDLRAWEKLPGTKMMRREDGTVWFNPDGLGWEQLHVCNAKP